MRLWRRHGRFVAALAVGVLLAIALRVMAVEPVAAALVAVNGFFLCYLGLMLRMTLKATAADLRHRADEDDEGIVLILILAVAAVGISLGAIVQVLARPDQSAMTAGLSLAAVPLGWAMVHTLAGYRYAHLFYAGGAVPGLTFPDTPEPGPWDFLYLAFGVGMTAQVADVVVATARMRRTVLLHSVGAFFYNTVILALAVNAGLVLGGAGS